jgi:hypothetical protein
VVDLTACCLAALLEADIGPYCNILAMQVPAVRTEQSLVLDRSLIWSCRGLVPHL